MDTEEKANEIENVEKEKDMAENVEEEGEISTENVKKEMTTENASQEPTTENVEIKSTIENAETEAAVENAEKEVTAKSPVNPFEQVMKLLTPVEKHDWGCPHCDHNGMKMAGGINRFTKPNHWKCLCPTYQSSCACRYGWKLG